MKISNELAEKLALIAIARATKDDDIAELTRKICKDYLEAFASIKRFKKNQQKTDTSSVPEPL